MIIDITLYYGMTYYSIVYYGMPGYAMLCDKMRCDAMRCDDMTCYVMTCYAMHETIGCTVLCCSVCVSWLCCVVWRGIVSYLVSRVGCLVFCGLCSVVNSCVMT